MSDRILLIQKWMADKNVPVALDGQPGPQTRNGLIEAFRNRAAPAATRQEIAAIAASLGASERQVLAVAKVECSGAGWDKSGLLACLYERHFLFRRIRAVVPLLANPAPGGYTIDADGDGINDSWEKLADAAMRWPMNMVFECASFGKFQIMGAHWKALGYRSVIEFVWSLSRTEFAHYDAFSRYIRANGLIDALRQVDGNPENCRPVAKGYNGPGYEKYRYHERIAAAFKGIVA